MFNRGASMVNPTVHDVIYIFLKSQNRRNCLRSGDAIYLESNSLRVHSFIEQPLNNADISGIIVSTIADRSANDDHGYIACLISGIAGAVRPAAGANAGIIRPSVSTAASTASNTAPIIAATSQFVRGRLLPSAQTSYRTSPGEGLKI